MIADSTCAYNQNEPYFQNVTQLLHNRNTPVTIQCFRAAMFILTILSHFCRIRKQSTHENEKKSLIDERCIMAKSDLMLSGDQESYLAWLLTPEDSRNPSSKKEYAELHGMHYNTLLSWEKKKPFQERWRLGIEGLAQSPDRTQKLLDALYIKALSGDVKSCELYLRATGFLQQSSTLNIKSETSVKSLSDDELQELILQLSANKKVATLEIQKVNKEGD